MVQIENEYGGFHTCDRDYLRWLRDETHKYVRDQALLFTTDIPDLNIKCGKIDGVFATTDFGIDRGKTYMIYIKMHYLIHNFTCSQRN